MVRVVREIKVGSNSKRAGVLCLLIWLVCFFCGCAADKALTLTVGEASTEQSGEIRAGTDGADGVTYTEAQGESSAPVQETFIYVYVCGAVQEPGVVELPEGSRAQAALEAAGGFTGEAQTDYVNLAARLSDGEKLYFPKEEEVAQLLRQEEIEEQGLVNINTADEEELCTLPGIGEAKARDIIRYREENGLFRTPEDIMKVSGIKENAYAKLKDKIVTQ